MITIFGVIIMLTFIIGLNLIPVFIKPGFDRYEKRVIQIANYTLVTFIIVIILAVMDFQPGGMYANSIIAVAFILSQLLYFSLVKNKPAKIIRVTLVTPLLLFGLLMLIFHKAVVRFRINNEYTIHVFEGGAMGCGENVKITKTSYLIFEKGVHYNSSLCLKGITKIETIKFTETQGTFLIYHDGSMDSENPYKYTTQITETSIW